MYYLFHGKDTFSQHEFLAGLLAKEGDADMVSLNTTRLSGKVTFNELQGACDAVPFLARVRVVIVEGLFAAGVDKAFLDRLAAYLPTLPATTRLFFLEADALPPNLREDVRPGHVDTDGWTLLAAHNAAAAKLRQLLPHLQQRAPPSSIGMRGPTSTRRWRRLSPRTSSSSTWAAPSCSTRVGPTRLRC